MPNKYLPCDHFYHIKCNGTSSLSNTCFVLVDVHVSQLRLRVQLVELFLLREMCKNLADTFSRVGII